MNSAQTIDHASSPSKPMDIDENCLKILDVLALEPYVSQRELSEKMGFSVGLINLIIKRLVKTGYIKMSNWTPKRVGYCLTKAGMAEQTRRSYHYLNQTIQTYKLFLKRSDLLLSDLVRKGHRRFVVVGEGEIADLIKQSLQKMEDQGIEWRQVSHDQTDGKQPDETILDTRFLNQNATTGVSILNSIMNVNESNISNV